MKKVFLFFLVIPLLQVKAQVPLTATINIANTVPRVERNFTGFNSGQGNLESIYKYSAFDADLSVNKNFYDVFARLGKNITWRFPGGTTASYYNRWASGYGNNGLGQTYGDWLSFNIVDAGKRNAIYGSYSNYNTPGYPNSRNNIIFPFINSITNNRTASNNAVFCINIINHYRDVPFLPYNTRKEMLKDTTKIKAIIDLDENYLEAFNSSTLSNEFKKIVRQNIDAYLTLVGNGVTVYRVEIGNELYAYGFHDNTITDYNTFINNSFFLNPSDTKVWFRDDVSEASIQNSYTSLWTYAHLAKLYRVLLTDTLQKLSADPESKTASLYKDHLNNIKFGVPISATLNGGFKRWDDFMRQENVKDYIGINAYIIHPYFDSINFFKDVALSDLTNDNESDLETEFSTIRDTLEISYNNRFFKKNQVELINAFPEGTEVWYTEWNFNFDHSNLRKVGNTMLHAMYYYDAMMNFFDINANKNLNISCNKKNPIKICNYHMPYSRNTTWYNMTRFPKWASTIASDPYKTTNLAANAVAYNAAYYTHLLLLPALEDTDLEYVDNTNGGFDNVANCSFRTFYKKDCSSGCCHDNVYIYFNNKSETDYKLDLAAALNISNSKCVVSYKNYLYASKLYASMGQTTFRADNTLYGQASDNSAEDVTIQRVFNQEIPDSLLSEVVIPKYALGYIIADITVPSEGCACGSAARKKSPDAEPAERISGNDNITQMAEPVKNTPIRMYPNPSPGNVSLDITSSKEVAAQVNVFDITGNLVKTFNKDLSSGQNTVELDLYDLAKATYIIRISGADIEFMNKVVLQ